MLRNLVTALFQYERIETTVAKAKEARRLAERMITFAKRGDLAARRHVARFVMRPAVTRKLFDTIAPWYAERDGGYTRIIRIGRRLGDAGETAYLELVKIAEQKEKERAGPASPRRRPRRRRSRAARSSRARRRRRRPAAAEASRTEAPKRGRARRRERSPPPRKRAAGPGSRPAEPSADNEHARRGREGHSRPRSSCEDARCPCRSSSLRAR